MNKFGIKLYRDNIEFIDNINYRVNSIKHFKLRFNDLNFKFRMINEKSFGIELRRMDKKI